MDNSIDLDFQEINQDPQILIYKNFLSEEYCMEVIKQGKDNLKRAKVISEKNNSIKVSKGRTNKAGFIPRDISFGKESFKEIIKRKFSLTEEKLTEFQILRYDKDQQYIQHLDSFSQKYLSKTKKNQRTLTFILYLNDDIKGGETFFPLLNISIPPCTGDLLVFKNCFGESSFTHPKSLHGSKPVTSGTKWVLLFWSNELIAFQK